MVPLRRSAYVVLHLPYRNSSLRQRRWAHYWVVSLQAPCQIGQVADSSSALQMSSSSVVPLDKLSVIPCGVWQVSLAASCLSTTQTIPSF